MKQYRDLVEYVLTNGVRQSNRTGVDTFKCNGYMMKFDHFGLKNYNLYSAIKLNMAV